MGYQSQQEHNVEYDSAQRIDDNYDKLGGSDGEEIGNNASKKAGPRCDHGSQRQP
jgi:hypothetical protein